MGRQIRRLYLDVVDAQTVQMILGEKLGLRFLLPWTPTPEPVDAEILKPGKTVMLCREEDLHLFEPRYVPGRNEWWFGHDGNPTVEWMISREEDKRLHPGRFYYQADYWLEGARQSKSDEFIKSAEKILRLARASFFRFDAPWGRVNVGPNVKARLLDRKVELAMN